MSEENLRYTLRAYESTDACRLASILQELASRSKSVTRDAVAARWAERYPRHAGQTGNQSIRSRISKVLSLLKVAGIARAQGSDIVITDSGQLKLAAGNLTIVEDNAGRAIRPGRWSRRPDVPKHLLAVQEPLERRRLDAADD